MSKEIVIEISDEIYEELSIRAREIQKSYLDVCGKPISADRLIYLAADLGIIPHIKCSMDIFERNLKNRGAQNEQHESTDSL